MPFEPSFSEARRSLGSTVDAVLRGWQDAAQSSSVPTQRVRALLTIGQVGEWEFSWREEVIHRLLSPGILRPLTRSEEEMLRKCMVHGWFFVYRVEGGQEPLILHSVGIEIEDSPESLRFSTPFAQQSECTDLRMGYKVEEVGITGSAAPQQEIPLPMKERRHRDRVLKPSVACRLVLLLVSGVVIGSVGWHLTRRSEFGLLLALSALVLLGRTLIAVIF
jgi:hypothetical protein